MSVYSIGERYVEGKVRMPRTIYSATIIVILAMGMLSSNAQAAAEFTSELSQIEITLPSDRWTLTKSDERDRGERVRAWFGDSEDVANFFFLERRRRGRYTTIDEWLAHPLGAGAGAFR